MMMYLELFLWLAIVPNTVSVREKNQFLVYKLEITENIYLRALYPYLNLLIQKDKIRQNQNFRF